MIIKNADGTVIYVKSIGNGSESSPFITANINPLIHIPLGLLDDLSSSNKFGFAEKSDADVDCDTWDGANSVDNQPVWIMPIAARIHTIASTSTDDANGGIGANSIQVYGLTSWDADEVSEVVVMNGTTGVNTVNSYVIIHRIKVIPASGQTSPNVGYIKATALVDATITAMIIPEKGQTLMAIYGIPSTKKVLISRIYASTVKAATSLSTQIGLRINPNPNIQGLIFLCKNTVGLTTEGSNYIDNEFAPHMLVEGPAIIKITANSSADNTEVSAGFDMYLFDV